MIKVVVLDLDGVYFLNSHQNFKNNLNKKFNLSENKIGDIYFGGQKMRDYKLGKITGDEFWKWAIQEWKIKTTKKDILHILARGYLINKKADNLIKKLKKQNIKIALCTNNFLERIEIVDQKLNFLKNFDIKVFSYEEGIAKPDPNIFKILIDRAKVKPVEIVYFDDSEKAVESAKSVGISAFLFNGFGSMVEKLKELKLEV